MVDPIKDIFPSCTMPLASTVPLTAIMRDQEHAKDYLTHASLVRELLDKSSIPTDPNWLSSCGNAFMQNLSGQLTHASRLLLAKEPIPPSNIVRMVNPCDRAAAVY